VRRSRFDFDQAQVKPYFELDRVLKDGVLYAAHELYGVTFTERTDLLSGSTLRRYPPCSHGASASGRSPPA
jgi:hypothetical protein